MKTTLTRILILNTLMLSSTALSGQPPHKQDKIKALKISFITSRLDLTPSEAEVFWPVYNQFEKELDVIMEERAENMKNRDLQAMSEKEIEAVIDKQIQSEEDEISLKKSYHAKFKEVLPVKKVALLYLAERDFKIWILGEIKKRKDQGNKRPFKRQ